MCLLLKLDYSRKFGIKNLGSADYTTFTRSVGLMYIVVWDP